MNIYKSKDKDNKDNEIILQQRSATVVQPQNYKNQKNDKKENDSGGGLFKNLKNKFLNKDKKNKEAEDNKFDDNLENKTKLQKTNFILVNYKNDYITKYSSEYFNKLPSMKEKNSKKRIRIYF